MKPKTLFIILVSAVLLIFTASFLENIYDHQVRQEVVLNEHNIYDNPYSEIPSMFRYSTRNADGTMDSTALKDYHKYEAEMEARQKERIRKYDAPFKLITSYNHHKVVDYGTAEQIDSIKCLRYHDMIMNRIIYDVQDLNIKIAKKNQELAEEAVEKARKELLDKLNKSCE